MKLEIVLCFIICLSASLSFGQIDEERSIFLTHRIEELKSKYPDELIKISGTRLKWDTTEFVFTRFLSRFDTTDYTDLSIKSKPVRMKIVNLMNDLGNQDYDLIKNQIKNQNTDTFIKEIVLNVTKKKKKIAKTYYFSQPIVVNNADMIIVKELVKTNDGYQYFECNLYKKLDQKWNLVTNLETWGFIVE